MEQAPDTDKVAEKIVENNSSASSEDAAAQIGEKKNIEPQLDKNMDSLIESVDGKDKKPDASAAKKSSMEDKIVADDIYTSPPAYDQLGRGLVYNCKDKYWSCVDKLSYVACNKNMKWNKDHTKPAECFIQNVYNSDDDCSAVQKYNVSSNKDTAFCR